jgi:hypothetical protein
MRSSCPESLVRYRVLLRYIGSGVATAWRGSPGSNQRQQDAEAFAAVRAWIEIPICAAATMNGNDVAASGSE